MEIDRFLGEPVGFWIEVKKWYSKGYADPPQVSRLMKELYELRARVSFYESRVKEMNELRETGAL
jgi:hypothetical protein